MADKIIENNQVSIIGKVASSFTFSHQVFGEGFYLVDVSCEKAQRLGGQDPSDGFRTSGRCEPGL